MGVKLTYVKPSENKTSVKGSIINEPEVDDVGRSLNLTDGFIELENFNESVLLNGTFDLGPFGVTSQSSASGQGNGTFESRFLGPFNSSSGHGGHYNFHRMQYASDFVLYFFCLISLFASNVMAEYLRKHSKAIPRKDKTVLTYVKTNLVELINMDVSINSFTTMIRLMISPFNYEISLAIIFVRLFINSQMMISLAAIFVIKVLLVKFEGLVESIEPRVLSNWITLGGFSVLILPSMAEFVYRSVYVTNIPGVAYLSDMWIEDSGFLIQLVVVNTLFGVLVVSIILETCVNYQAINLISFKRMVIFGMIELAATITDFVRMMYATEPLLPMTSIAANVVGIYGQYVFANDLHQRRKKTESEEMVIDSTRDLSATSSDSGGPPRVGGSLAGSDRDAGSSSGHHSTASQEAGQLQQVGVKKDDQALSDSSGHTSLPPSKSPPPSSKDMMLTENEVIVHFSASTSKAADSEPTLTSQNKSPSSKCQEENETKDIQVKTTFFGEVEATSSGKKDFEAVLGDVIKKAPALSDQEPATSSDDSVNQSECRSDLHATLTESTLAEDVLDERSHGVEVVLNPSKLAEDQNQINQPPTALSTSSDTFIRSDEDDENSQMEKIDDYPSADIDYWNYLPGTVIYDDNSKY